MEQAGIGIFLSMVLLKEVKVGFLSYIICLSPL